MVTTIEGVERLVCPGEEAVTVDAHEEKEFVNFKNSTIVINYWPWATKGPYYIAMDR